MMGSVRERLAGLRRAYAPHEHRPLDGYVVAMGAFGALAGSLAAAAKVTGRPVPERPATSDVVLISIATHKLSRLARRRCGRVSVTPVRCDSSFVGLRGCRPGPCRPSRAGSPPRPCRGRP